jgi:hypothetical protein
MYFTKSGVINASTVNIVSGAILSAANTTAKITFGANPGLEVGDILKVENLGVDFNHSGAVVTNITSNIVSYTIAGSAVSSNVTADVVNNSRIAVLNSVDETPYVAVTELTAGGDSSTYNVPGNKDYNPDVAVDRIIISNENPTA